MVDVDTWFAWTFNGCHVALESRISLCRQPYFGLFCEEEEYCGRRKRMFDFSQEKLILGREQGKKLLILCVTKFTTGQ